MSWCVYMYINQVETGWCIDGIDYGQNDCYLTQIWQ